MKYVLTEEDKELLLKEYNLYQQIRAVISIPKMVDNLGRWCNKPATYRIAATQFLTTHHNAEKLLK